MYIKGGLIPAIARSLGNNAKIAGLIIDEEDNDLNNAKFDKPFIGCFDHANITLCQQRLLMYMQSMGCPIWSINFHYGAIPSILNAFTDNTRTRLRAMYNGEVNFIAKPETNAFIKTDLHQQLEDHKISILVIMGFHTEACVKNTIGNEYFQKANALKYGVAGALHLGYTVMTCDQVLHGGNAQASWRKNEAIHYENLKFYTDLQ